MNKMTANFLCFISLAPIFIIGYSSEADYFETKVIYSEWAGCCDQLTSLEPVLSDFCSMPHSSLFAINIGEFESNNNYINGDTLSIQYVYYKECEAIGEPYNCPVTCDKRHGLPIQILEIGEN